MNPKTCLVCGGAYAKSKLAGLLSCKTCNFVTADVTVSREDLEGIYSAKYFAGEEYKDYVSERRLIEKNFRIRLQTLLNYVPNAPGKRLFEIGSAYGFFLSVAQDHFASVEGIDLSCDAATFAVEKLRLCVHAGDFLEYRIQNKIDVACLWDTIEHLETPHLYLEKLTAYMDRGGIIAITTGDIRSLVARLRGTKWRQIHPPTHLHYFSRDTLTLLLRKYGFAVRHCGHEGMQRSLDTIAYIILNIKHQRPELYARLKKVGFLRWDIYLNLYDILFVVAEKQ